MPRCCWVRVITNILLLPLLVGPNKSFAKCFSTFGPRGRERNCAISFAAARGPHLEKRQIKRNLSGLLIRPVQEFREIIRPVQEFREIILREIGRALFRETLGRAYPLVASEAVAVKLGVGNNEYPEQCGQHVVRKKAEG